MIAPDGRDGTHQTPKGVRHSDSVHAIANDVPLNVLSK